MKARTWLFLLTAVVMLATAGPGFGKSSLRNGTTHLTWGGMYGGAGPIEGPDFDYKPTECVTWLTPAYPVLHPMPRNSDGTPADCAREGTWVSADKDISVKDTTGKTVVMTGAALAQAAFVFHDNGFGDKLDMALELKVDATVDTNKCGTDCLAVVSTFASYYGDNLDCECQPGAQLSLVMELFGGADVLHPVTVTVDAASDTNRQTDSFSATPGVETLKITTPLRIGPSGKFSVLITLGADQNGVGTAIGRVLGRVDGFFIDE